MNKNPLHSSYQPQKHGVYMIKIKILFFFISLGFALLLGRLFFLQVLQGNYYQTLALNNSKQVINISSHRGEVYAKDGVEKIVENAPAYSLYLVPNNFPSKLRQTEVWNTMQKNMLERFDIDREQMARVLRRGRLNPYRPYLLKPNISQKELHYLAENLDQYPGLLYLSIPLRVYPGKEKYAHVTGYIRPISAREVKKKKDLGYSVISMVGKLGLEAYYDLELRGREGYKVQIVDAQNQMKDEIFPEDGIPIAGKDIITTIDSRIQNIVYETLEGYPGGIVVSHAKTGEILALHSYPSYDPNIFQKKIDKAVFAEFSENKEKPFFNRVTQGEYPPSSIFKLILAITALDRSAIDIDKFSVYCTGGVQIGPKYFKGTGYHRTQNVYQAIANSCNVYFYHLGLNLGPQLISHYAQNYFNLGKPLGIDIPFEKGGLIPSQKWKIENKGTFWWDGDTANFSIGQGFALVTIMQIHAITAAIANGGTAYKPHLLKSFISPETDEVFEERKQVLFELPFKRSQIEKIRKALSYVVQWGTAYRIHSNKFSIAGKTGTAQISSKVKPTAWFTGFAPYKKTDSDDVIVVTVLLEQGGLGAELAAPFAKAVFDGIFLNKNPRLSIKETLQPWALKRAIYKDWLNRRNEKELPEGYFKPISAIEKKETDG